jgi:spore coat protein CotH
LKILKAGMSKTPSINQKKRSQRRHGKQDDAEFVKGKTRVMNRVKGLQRNFEPSMMHCVHPVMGKHKNSKPDEQNRVIDERAPEKNFFDLIYRHDNPPSSTVSTKTTIKQMPEVENVSFSVYNN